MVVTISPSFNLYKIVVFPAASSPTEIKKYILEQRDKIHNTVKIFLIFSSGGHFIQQSRTVCVVLVEDIMRNISAKLF